MSLESAPVLQRGPGFEFDFREPPLEQFMARFNSPLLYGPFTFSSCVEALGLHPTTASILDDMRFLVTTVLNLAPQPSAQEVTKLKSTAMWIHDRISKLPVDLPCEPPKPPLASSKLPIPSQNSTGKGGPSGSHKMPGTETGVEAKPHSLLPHYPEYVTSMSEANASPSTVYEYSLPSLQQSKPREHDCPPSSQHTGPKLAPLRTPNTEHPALRPEPDALYTAVRLAAPLFARAIGTRRPLSSVCSPVDAFGVLSATWRIPLARWRGVIGILLFTLISIVGTASGSGSLGGNGGGGEMMALLLKHSGFVKSILQIGFMQMALESWEVCRETMGRAARLLAWLREGEEEPMGIREEKVAGKEVKGNVKVGGEKGAGKA